MRVDIPFAAFVTVGQRNLMSALAQISGMLRRTIGGSRPSLIESGWKNASRLVRKLEAIQWEPPQAKTGPKNEGSSHAARDRGRLAKPRERRKTSCRFGVHSETLGYAHFLY
jgi:hypothetical protein